MQFINNLKKKFCKGCGKRPDEKRPTLNSKQSLLLSREIIKILEKEPLMRREIIKKAQEKGFTSHQIEWGIRKLVNKGQVKFITRTKGYRLYFLQESVV